MVHSCIFPEWPYPSQLPLKALTNYLMSRSEGKYPQKENELLVIVIFD